MYQKRVTGHPGHNLFTIKRVNVHCFQHVIHQDCMFQPCWLLLAGTDFVGSGICMIYHKNLLTQQYIGIILMAASMPLILSEMHCASTFTRKDKSIICVAKETKISRGLKLQKNISPIIKMTKCSLTHSNLQTIMKIYYFDELVVSC